MHADMIFLFDFDKSIFSWINADWSNPFFDWVMPWITHLADAAIVWIWMILIGLVAGWKLAVANKTDRSKSQQRLWMIKAGLFFCLYVALMYGVNAGVYNLAKHLAHRSRPFVEQTVVLRVPSITASNLRHDSSFPSGHAANAFMVAAILADRFRRKRHLFYGLAAWVALSRIYLGVHYPSDVVAGGCLGFIITWAMLSFHSLRNRIMREDLLQSQN
jgi:undecaprenyl-diphosphatase